MKHILLSFSLLFTSFINIASQPNLYPKLNIIPEVRIFDSGDSDSLVLYVDVKNVKGGFANNSNLQLYSSIP